MRAYGSEVTILEAMPHLLPREDEKVSQTLERSFSRQGITHHLGVAVDRATNLGDHVEVAYTKDGKSHVIEADRCLVAVSVQPNTENLGLEEAGVVLERGYVKVDERMATNVSGIWAIGDVTTTPYALAHVASAEGVLAAEAIAGHDTHPIRYQDVPRPTFCFPQVASVGLTEKQARDAGHDVKIGEVPYAASGKSLANDETDGFVKLVIDAKFGEILGAQRGLIEPFHLRFSQQVHRRAGHQPGERRIIVNRWCNAPVMHARLPSMPAAEGVHGVFNPPRQALMHIGIKAAHRAKQSYVVGDHIECFATLDPPEAHHDGMQRIQPAADRLLQAAHHPRRNPDCIRALVRAGAMAALAEHFDFQFTCGGGEAAAAHPYPARSDAGEDMHPEQGLHPLHRPIGPHPAGSLRGLLGRLEQQSHPRVQPIGLAGEQGGHP